MSSTDFDVIVGVTDYDLQAGSFNWREKKIDHVLDLLKKVTDTQNFNDARTQGVKNAISELQDQNEMLRDALRGLLSLITNTEIE